MSDTPAESPAAPPTAAKPAKPKRHRLRKFFAIVILLLLIGGVVGRIYLNTWAAWYVNRVIDQNKLYDGKIDSLTIDMYRGRYSINHIKLLKVTGNVSSPFFECERLDLAVEWAALLHGRVKATAYVEKPQINFVQEQNDADGQTGGATGAGPWLGILRDLSPFDINSATIHDGSLHFKAPDRTPIVDVFLDELNVDVKNLSNVVDRTKTLNATVDLKGRAMESGVLEMRVSFDPLSYKPTFDLALRLLRLDVTETNPFTQAYGKFDFERGYFDLIVELKSDEGMLSGYVKPIFRNLSILGARDFRGGNILNGFWQALLGGVETILQNQPRDQFATQIPVTGILDAPKPDLLTTIGNVLRNAFVRAYLPRLEGSTVDLSGVQFEPGSVVDPGNESDLGK